MVEQEAAGGGLALDRLRAVWTRRKWLGIISFVMPLAAAVTLVMALPNVFSSSATVLIEGQQVPENFVKSTVTSQIETRLQTMSQEILSRPRLEALVTRFGLYPDIRKDTPEGRGMDEAIDRIRRDVKLELQEGSASTAYRKITVAFALSFRGGDPQKVALVANNLASAFVEENLKVREQYATGTTNFLRAQVAEAKKRLDEQERQVGALRARYQGELPQQMQANLARLEQMGNQLRLNNDNQVRLAERRDALAAQLAQARAESGNEPDDVRLQRLKGELATLRVKYTDLWPDIIRLKDEISTLEKSLAAPKPKKPVEDIPLSPQALRIQEALKSAETEVALLKAEDQRLRRDIAAYQERIENAPKREQEFTDLTRDYESSKETYYSLLKRYDEAQIGESMEQRQKGEQFRILEPAAPSYTPAAPNRLRLLLMSVALAGALGVGAMFVAEILDSSFHSVNELRAFSTLPVLVAIPRIVTEGDARRKRNRFRLATAGVLAGLVLCTGASFLIASGNDRLTNLVSPQKDKGR